MSFSPMGKDGRRVLFFFQELERRKSLPALYHHIIWEGERVSFFCNAIPSHNTISSRIVTPYHLGHLTCDGQWRACLVATRAAQED